MDLNKRIGTNDPNNLFHSHVFAVTANSDRMGSTANTSFEQRKNIKFNRQVAPVHQPLDVGTSRGVRAKSFVPIRTASPINQPRITSIQPKVINVPPRSFKQPEPRPYNPFA